MMADINQDQYQASHQALTEAGVNDPLADVVSRIVASDDPSLPDLGRLPVDNFMCLEAVKCVNFKPNKDE
jgi:hypothetical protein